MGTKTDFLVIGGGIIGLSVARELIKTFSDIKVTLIEKEKDCGLHASGRNSGVLHAGFYYTSDSLKARFTKDGNKALTNYCEEKKIKINKCGKLVVAKNENDLPLLNELLKRGKSNGVDLNEISEEEAKCIEPRAKTYKRALFSPTTSTVNPQEVLKAIKHDALSEGVRILPGVKYVKRIKNNILTSEGIFDAGYIINAAGLYADVIAHDFGFSKQYKILPFKGLYLYSNEPIGSIRTNVYPVPDLRNPFLGVHFTVTVDGNVKIGPTAIPAFWREQYNFFDNFNPFEFVDIVSREIDLFMFSNFDFKKLAIEEIQKYSKSKLVKLASMLASDVQEKHYKTWGKAGIRAQLVNLKEKKLEMDFVIEGNEQSLHILNVVSPGFTCAIPFAKYVCDKINNLLKGVKN